MKKTKKISAQRVSVKLTELARWFFRIVDEVGDDAIPHVTPLLVKILKDFDNILYGSQVNTDSPTDMRSNTAIDVRSFYVIFKRSRILSPQERRKKIEKLRSYFFPGQIAAIMNLAPTEERDRKVLPFLLMPVFRAVSFRAPSKNKQAAKKTRPTSDTATATLSA